MIREALYHKTVGILVDAYFKDTLQHYNCYACAVGNIIAGNCGFTFATLPEKECALKYPNLHLYWKGFRGYRNLFTEEGINDTATYYTLPNIKADPLPSEIEAQIKKTGYTLRELTLIERAFESPEKTYGDSMFDGLMSVIECLDKIHQNTDQSISNSSKSRFSKAHVMG